METRHFHAFALDSPIRKLSPDGTHANMVTGHALTDMGRATTFYDVLVEAARIEA